MGAKIKRHVVYTFPYNGDFFWIYPEDDQTGVEVKDEGHFEAYAVHLGGGKWKWEFEDYNYLEKVQSYSMEGVLENLQGWQPKEWK